MRDFAQAFLLVFAQLAVGGFFTLSIPPFDHLERGFFKSSAAVYLAAALIALVGWTTLELRAGTTARLPQIGLWGAFAAAAGVYLYSLWGDPYRLRARAYVATLALGISALTATAWTYHAPAPSVTAIVYPLSFLLSALVLGGASSGMLLGHWYLIDTGLTLTPFRRMHRFFVRAMHAQIVLLAVSVVLLWLFSPAAAEALARLWTSHRFLLALRLILGPIAAYALAAMIRRTLDIPQTMAATGLFYIALLSVIVGEILGRTILFRTSLPL